MTNKQIAAAFHLLAKLMELHGENPYKIRSYQKANGLLSKLGTPLSEMAEAEIKSLPGVGKAISGKIQELLTGGKMRTLERYKDMTPRGIQEMVLIKGLGAKKIKAAWDELGVESATELLYACQENRLIELKGFGAKTQGEIKKQLEFFLKNQSNFLFVHAAEPAEELLVKLQANAQVGRAEYTGALRRMSPILDCLEYLVACPDRAPSWEEWDDLEVLEVKPDIVTGVYGSFPIVFYVSVEAQFERRWWETTGPSALVSRASEEAGETEAQIFGQLDLPYIPPECRELATEVSRSPAALVDRDAILGVIHTHSTYSDGVNTLEEMGNYAQEQGYRYLGITDHSQIAVYANGATEEDVVAQWEEVDQINRANKDFRILKGIECDILANGDLDYSDEFRAGFEFVISSIHTTIKMDEAKATARTIKAIEHPHTNILGHPTGRLLLGRDGYPLDMAKVIDACAANQVAIELNASPYRLDLDWQWIPLAVERGVKICINPDAHAREAIDYIDFGVIIARKGWLPREACLNALPAEDFLAFCSK